MRKPITLLPPGSSPSELAQAYALLRALEAEFEATRELLQAQTEGAYWRVCGIACTVVAVVLVAIAVWP